MTLTGRIEKKILQTMGFRKHGSRQQHPKQLNWNKRWNKDIYEGNHQISNMWIGEKNLK